MLTFGTQKPECSNWSIVILSRYTNWTIELRFLINLSYKTAYILKFNPLEHPLGLVSNSIHTTLA